MRPKPVNKPAALNNYSINSMSKKGRPKNTVKYSDDQIIAALKVTKGMVFIAAERLGCDPSLIYKRQKTSEAIHDAIKQQNGLFVDHAEIALWKAVQAGEGWAVCFALKTKGKDRGYVERQEVTGKDGVDLFKPPAAMTNAEVIAERERNNKS